MTTLEDLENAIQERCLKLRISVFGLNPPVDHLVDYANRRFALVSSARYHNLGMKEEEQNCPCPDRHEAVMHYQAVFDNVFWSKKTLIRLLIDFLMRFYLLLLDQKEKTGTVKFPDRDDYVPLMHTVWQQQSVSRGTFCAAFIVPPLRPVDFIDLVIVLQQFTYHMSTDWANERRRFVERDNMSDDEFLQYWYNWCRNTSNHPASWYSWHNDVFPEHYEYPHLDDPTAQGRWDIEVPEAEFEMGRPNRDTLLALRTTDAAYVMDDSSTDDE